MSHTEQKEHGGAKAAHGAEHHESDGHHEGGAHRGMIKKILEGIKSQPLPETIKRRLEMDFTNRTADYSRINLTEAFSGFNYDLAATETQWRLGKIMDAYTICHDEYDIIDGPSFRPNDVPMLYQLAREKKLDEPIITIKIKNPAEPDGAKLEDKKVSYADLAHFIDAAKVNRELGINKLPTQELLYRFFSNPRATKLEIPDLSVATANGSEPFNLLGEDHNPRDNYADIDMEYFLDQVKKSQLEMQQSGDWRFTSGGHREIAGQSYVVSIEGALTWVLMSGELAQKITFEDLQKQNERGSQSAALGGQPQEVGDMEEGATGAVVRFRYRFLRQRRSARIPSSLNSSTSPRMGKAMVGLTIMEDPETKLETLPSGEKKKNIILCGEQLNSKVIQGIQLHYNDSRTKRGLPKLSDKEAADVAFTDIFAPCILNNEIDWLVALSKAYSVSAPNAIVNTKGPFPGFVLSMYCRDYSTEPKGEIRLQKFESFNDLSDYVDLRLSMGHIDQGPRNASERGARASDVITDAKEPKAKPIEKLTDEDAKKYSELLLTLLGPGYESYLTKYSQGKDGFNSIRVKDKRVPPGEMVEGQTKKTFANIIEEEMAATSLPDLYLLLKEVHPWMEDDDSGDPDEESVIEARDAVVNTLLKLSREDRKKLQPTK